MNELMRDGASRPEERAAAYRDMIRARSDDMTTPEWAADWRAETHARPAPVAGLPGRLPALGNDIARHDADGPSAHRRARGRADAPAMPSKLFANFAELPTASDDADPGRARRLFRHRGGADAADAGQPAGRQESAGDEHACRSSTACFPTPGSSSRCAIRAMSCSAASSPTSSSTTAWRTSSRLDTAAELYDLSFSYFERAQRPCSTCRRPPHRLREHRRGSRPRAARAVRLPRARLARRRARPSKPPRAGRGRIKTASYAQVVEPIYTALRRALAELPQASRAGAPGPRAVDREIRLHALTARTIGSLIAEADRRCGVGRSVARAAIARPGGGRAERRTVRSVPASSPRSARPLASRAQRSTRSTARLRHRRSISWRC